jgi:hypothetical protein
MTTELIVDHWCPALFFFDADGANSILTSAFHALGG